MPLKDSDAGYTERLLRERSRTWKRVVDVQAPYRWNIRRLKPGRVLDIGCGIGRNLLHLRGNGVGIDHNAHSVKVCRDLGLRAYEPHDFWQSADATSSFDSLLLAHVAEHMDFDDCVALIRSYAPLLVAGGRAIIITPQEAGQASDPTHRSFVDFEVQEKLFEATGFAERRFFSFPFPRILGPVFRYNEFVGVGRKVSEDDR